MKKSMLFFLVAILLSSCASSKYAPVKNKQFKIVNCGIAKYERYSKKQKKKNARKMRKCKTFRK